MLKESLRILRDLGDRLRIADDFRRLARTLAFAGRADAALRLVPCSEALYEETGRSVALDREAERVDVQHRPLELDEARSPKPGSKAGLDARRGLSMALDA